jgi:ABC-type polysaccharide/polyol phosphate export permease
MEFMPAWIQKVAPYLPAYAMVQLVRPPLVDGNLCGDLGLNLLVMAGYTIVAGLFAARLFRWAPRT